MKTIFGFSLIELLVVLSIIGILVAFATPHYSQHVVSERRLAAESALLDLAGELETYYIQHQSYNGATIAAIERPELTAKGSYRLAIEKESAHEFEVLAIPQGKQAEEDQRCGTLSLTSRGVKGIQGFGELGECW